MNNRWIISPVVRATEKALLAVPALARLYMAPYKTVVQKEIKLAGLRPGERVLQIGAGSIPFRAIYLMKLADVSVCAIDIDRGAVRRAREWIRRLQLADRIQIEAGDGRSFPVHGFTAAFVALQAEPKREILAHLLRAGPDGFRIIARQPRKKFSSQYSMVPKNWQHQGEIKQPMITFSSSLLFTKNGVGAKPQPTG